MDPKRMDIIYNAILRQDVPCVPLDIVESSVLSDTITSDELSVVSDDNVVNSSVVCPNVGSIVGDMLGFWVSTDTIVTSVIVGDIVVGSSVVGSLVGNTVGSKYVVSNRNPL